MKPPKAARRASKAERIDAALSKALVVYRDNPALRVAGAASEAADQPPLIALCVATVAAGAVLRHPRLLRAGLRMLASEGVATGVKSVIKRHVNRTRPHKMLRDGRYSLHTDGKGSKNEGPWNSFPSGHTAGAVAVARAATREYAAAVPAAGLAATLVALVQLPRGRHFASDVLAGAVIGWASEAVVNAAMRRATRT